VIVDPCWSRPSSLRSSDCCSPFLDSPFLWFLLRLHSTDSVFVASIVSEHAGCPIRERNWCQWD
jgi:hypothetical protein